MRVLWISLISVVPLVGYAQIPWSKSIQSGGSGYFYQGSVVKESGWSIEGYGSGLWKNHRLEVGGMYTRIHFKGGAVLRQQEYTLSYTTYIKSRVWLRGGMHGIFSTDEATHRGWVGFLGIGLYQLHRWYAGIEGYLSQYPQYPGGLSVRQIMLSWGRTLFELYTNHTLTVEVQPVWIALSRSDITGKRNYFAVYNQWSLSLNRWLFRGILWAGEQVFAVRNGGFLVLNLPEHHTGAFGGIVSYTFTPAFKPWIGFFREQFRDIGYVEDVHLLIVSTGLNVYF